MEDKIAHQEAIEKREQKEKNMSEDDLQWEQGILYSIAFHYVSKVQ